MHRCSSVQHAHGVASHGERNAEGLLPGGSVETSAQNLQEHLHHRNTIRSALIYDAALLYRAITMEVYTHANMNDKRIAMDVLQ